MSTFDLTSRPHPARRARRVVGVTSIATTVGIAGALAVNQRVSSAEEANDATATADVDTGAASVLDTTPATPVATTLSSTTRPPSTVPPTTLLPTTLMPTTLPSTTATTAAAPGDNPFGPRGALSDLTGLVVTTTTTTTTTTTAAPRPRATAPPATAPAATAPPATAPPATSPPATSPPPPPTTVSNGS